MTGNDIYRAIEFLKAGELVAIPTETVYGLAANAFNANAVAKIYEVKNRPFFNPLIIHTDSVQKMKDWGLTIPDKMSQLINEFSPGPITFVIPSSKQIPDLVTAGTNAVAIRIPNHSLTLSLLEQIDFPLAAPSANPSGFISPTNAWHVNEQLGDKIAYILNGGECSVGIESTIISFVHEEPTLLRLGGISKEEIEKCIGPIIDGTQYTLTKDVEDEAPLAPGMLSRHYAPSHQLIFGNVKKYTAYFEPERIGVIAFSSIYENIPARNQFVLSMNRDLKEAAQKLFSAMREADKLDVDVILAEKFPDEGIGRAINDRLKRASVKE
jgi:L-threonylcarbamoyladenylate synthase